MKNQFAQQQEVFFSELSGEIKEAEETFIQATAEKCINYSRDESMKEDHM